MKPLTILGCLISLDIDLVGSCAVSLTVTFTNYSEDSWLLSDTAWRSTAHNFNTFIKTIQNKVVHF